MAKIRFWRLDRRPEGDIENGCLTLQNAETPVLKDGEFLLRTIYLSLDATNRLWMSEMEELYMPPVELGAPMRGFVLGEVMESRHPAYAPGDLAIGLATWSDYVVTDGVGFSPFALPPGLPLAGAFGVLAVAGPTAYFGLLDVGRPKAGETVVITAAAGAVGALVGQIAKLQGCRVVGVAGTPEKCRWLTEELGFDAAINYRDGDLKEAYGRACPEGIDLLFENVGGDVLDAGLMHMNLFGRVVICGLISMYNKGRVPGPVMFHNTIMKRLRIEGFVVLDYADRFGEAIGALAGWMLEGKLKYRLDVMDGIESSVEALRKLYTGGNSGKMMVRIGAEPA